jgi:hypothetical protein
VRLPSGRRIIAFFYSGPLSGAVSFDGGATSNADAFAQSWLSAQLDKEKTARGDDQLIIIATDGELYGHHKAFRDRFLKHLLRTAAPAQGFAVVSLGRYLRDHPPTREARITEPSAWSCAHGVKRWSDGCSCTEGETAWKPALRTALNRLSARLADNFERSTAGALRDPWAARDAYIALRNGWMPADVFWARYGPRHNWLFRNRASEEKARQLLEAQYFGQAMFTSCGWFFEDLDRIEPRNDVAYARKAISLTWQATGEDLQTDFLADLAAATSWRSARTGAELYLQLPRLTRGMLPPLPQPEDESAA